MRKYPGEAAARCGESRWPGRLEVSRSPRFSPARCQPRASQGTFLGPGCLCGQELRAAGPVSKLVAFYTRDLSARIISNLEIKILLMFSALFKVAALHF